MFFFSSISYEVYFFHTVLKARCCGFCSPQMCNTNLHTQCETNMLHKKCKKKTIFQWGFCRFCIVTSSLPEIFFLNLRNWKFFNANLLQLFAISTCTVWTKYASYIRNRGKTLFFQLIEKKILEVFFSKEKLEISILEQKSMHWKFLSELVLRIQKNLSISL